MASQNGELASPAGARSTLVAIGNFDGVHLGHQRVLQNAVNEAGRLGLAPIALTFDPHPAQVLSPHPQPMLTLTERKVELIRRIDPSLSVVIQPFTKELSQMSPEAFVQQLLLKELGAKVVSVGKNFRFGHNRAGDLDFLNERGPAWGLTAQVEPLTLVGGEVASSSRIRGLLQQGRVEAAVEVLGRPHSVSGQVVRGDQRGHSIGFPTANLGNVGELVPRAGVYACVVDRFDDARAKQFGKAVVNVGTRPTVGGRELRVEAHLLGFSGDLYGTRLRVHFLHRLRDERRFESLDALRAQIAKDADLAHQRLQGFSADPAARGAWL